MANSKMKSIFLLSFGTLLGAFGQLLFKIYFQNNTNSIFLYIGGGLVAYGIATLLYFYVLSWEELSWSYSFAGLSYIFTVFLAWYVLMENIPVLRWVGVVAIALGVALIGLS